MKLKNEKIQVVDKPSLFYVDYVNEQYRNGVTIGRLEEPEIPQELLQEAKSLTDTAIITINRYSKEAEDRKNDGQDKYFVLSDAENKMVNDVCSAFAHVIVLLNVGSMIDTSWFSDNEKIEAAVMLWQGGMEGGLAAADVLVGDVTPSGKLVDTCARNFDDYPSSEGYHESPDYVKYTEDIFVGYRYFETIPGKKECVVYPFGYGLSYTKFELSKIHACSMGEKIYVTVNVKNVGAYAGKEVVQLYYSAPKDKLTKPALELCGFEKTPLLAPGESTNILLSYNISDMASFDDLGVIEKSAYVMEKGKYQLFLGTSIRDTVTLDYGYELAEDKIVEKLHSYCAPANLGKRMLADGSYMDVPDTEVITKKFPCEYACEYHELEDIENRHRLYDVAAGRLTLDEFMTQLSDEEMIHLLVGQPNTGVANTCGMGNLPKFGIPTESFSALFHKGKLVKIKAERTI